MFNILNNYGDLDLEDISRFIMAQLKITDLVEENINLINGMGLLNTIDIDESGYFIDNNPPTIKAPINYNTKSQIMQNRIRNIIQVGINQVYLFDNIVKSFIKRGQNVDKGINEALRLIKSNFKKIVKERNLNSATMEEKFLIRHLILDKKDIDIFIKKLNYKSIL